MNNPAPQPLSGIPPAPPPASHPESDLAAHVRRLIAFLLHWSGLLSAGPSRQMRDLVQALHLLATLCERVALGDLAPRTADRPLAESHAAPSARLPRAQRQERLTPGIYAGLFFTRLAAIGARARLSHPPQPPISIFAPLAA